MNWKKDRASKTLHRRHKRDAVHLVDFPVRPVSSDRTRCFLSPTTMNVRRPPRRHHRNRRRSTHVSSIGRQQGRWFGDYGERRRRASRGAGENLVDYREMPLAVRVHEEHVSRKLFIVHLMNVRYNNRKSDRVFFNDAGRRFRTADYRSTRNAVESRIERPVGVRGARGGAKSIFKTRRQRRESGVTESSVYVRHRVKIARVTVPLGDEYTCNTVPLVGRKHV